MISNNKWNEEEIELLKTNIDKSVGSILAILSNNGFCRSREAVEKKKRKFVKASKIVKPEVKVVYSSECPHGELVKPIEFKCGTTKEDIKIVKIERPEFSTTLVVPDAHVSPGQDISRFKALGNYCNSKKPNNIVFMGDFGNFDSLSTWDAGKEQSHGKKYKDDVKACRQALLDFLGCLDKGYSPKIYFLGGNHDEGRIEKYIENHAQLRGHMDVAEDLRLDELGITYIPYKKFLTINGTLFTHAIMSAANTPVSGKNIMPTIASLTAKSVVVGHHHRFETMSYYRHGADDVQQVLLCGLFSEHTDDYADGGANAYNRCVVMLTHWGPGRFDVDQVSIERLKARYL